MTTSSQVVMYTMGLFTLAWEFGVVLLWYRVEAMRRSTTQYCLQCGHVLASTTQANCPEYGRIP